MSISIHTEKCLVIMTDTKSPSRLTHFYRSNGRPKLLIGGREYLPTSGSTNKNIHILSDDYISPLDWCIELYEDGNSEPFLYMDKYSDGDDEKVVMKILISTDTSLAFRRPSENFIMQFIESYNKGGIITEAEVTHDRVFESNGLGKLIYQIEPIETILIK